jgi:adenylate cyclase
VGIGLENTIIGDVVNTAFRLETASKSLDRDIVFNSSFYLMHPDENLRIIQEIKVKGKNETLKVSALTYDELRLWLRMHPAKL